MAEGGQQDGLSWNKQDFSRLRTYSRKMRPTQPVTLTKLPGTVCSQPDNGAGITDSQSKDFEDTQYVISGAPEKASFAIVGTNHETIGLLQEVCLREITPLGSDNNVELPIKEDPLLLNTDSTCDVSSEFLPQLFPSEMISIKSEPKDYNTDDDDDEKVPSLMQDSGNDPIFNYSYATSKVVDTGILTGRTEFGANVTALDSTVLVKSEPLSPVNESHTLSDVDVAVNAANLLESSCRSDCVANKATLTGRPAMEIHADEQKTKLHGTAARYIRHLDVFIKNVKAHPHLYRSQDKNYKNTIIRNAAWDAIGTAHGLSGTEAMLKWQCLRSCYSRQRRIYMQNKACDGEAVQAPTWLWYPVLHEFLDDSMENPVSVSSNDTLSTHGQFDIEGLERHIAAAVCCPKLDKSILVQSPVADAVVQSHRVLPPTGKEDRRSARKRKVAEEVIGDAIWGIAKFLQDSTSALKRLSTTTIPSKKVPAHDDMYHFCNSVILRIRSLDEHKQNVVRSEIESRLLELESMHTPTE